MNAADLVAELTSRSTLYARLDDREQAVVRSWIRMAHKTGQHYAETKAEIGND